MDLRLTNKECVKIKMSICCSYHEIVKLRNLRAEIKVTNTLTDLDFRRTDFDHLEESFGTRL